MVVTLTCREKADWDKVLEKLCLSKSTADSNLCSDILVAVERTYIPYGVRPPSFGMCLTLGTWARERVLQIEGKLGIKRQPTE